MNAGPSSGTRPASGHAPTSEPGLMPQLLHLYGQVYEDLGAAAGAGGDPEVAAEFSYHERTDDLQAKAGSRVEIESFRQPHAAVRDDDGEFLGLPVRRHFQGSLWLRVST